MIYWGCCTKIHEYAVCWVKWGIVPLWSSRFSVLVRNQLWKKHKYRPASEVFCAALRTEQRLPLSSASALQRHQHNICQLTFECQNHRREVSYSANSSHRRTHTRVSCHSLQDLYWLLNKTTCFASLVVYNQFKKQSGERCFPQSVWDLNMANLNCCIREKKEGNEALSNKRSTCA